MLVLLVLFFIWVYVGGIRVVGKVLVRIRGLGRGLVEMVVFNLKLIVFWLGYLELMGFSGSYW